MIRLGMIGCGTMAASHVRTLEPLKDRVRFAAFADIEKERAETAAAAAPGAIAVTDYRELLKHVDAVVVALPHDLHYQVGVDCLKAGKHVLMEKPLALTREECLKLIAMDKSPDPVLSVGYIMRYDSLWTTLGNYIREGTYGQTFHVSIWTEQYTDTSRGAWLGQAKRLGGGQLFSHGCHYIDLLLHWMGEPVCGTHVGTNLGTPWMEKEGTSNVSLKFKSGATGYHFGTWGARGSRLRYSVHAHCTKGMLELNHAEGTITRHRSLTGGDLPALQALAAPGEKVDDPKQVVVARRAGKGGKPVVDQMNDFLDCIEQKRIPSTNARESLRSLDVIWKLYDAEERNVVADLREKE
jgi:predicted dehydrogenase